MNGKIGVVLLIFFIALLAVGGALTSTGRIVLFQKSEESSTGSHHAQTTDKEQKPQPTPDNKSAPVITERDQPQPATNRSDETTQRQGEKSPLDIWVSIVQGIAAVVAAVATVILAKLARAQYRVYRSQLRIMHRQARIASQQAVLLSNQIVDAKAIQRARMSFMQGQVITSSLDDRRVIAAWAAMLIINSGHSTARRVSFWRNQTAVVGDLSTDFNFPPSNDAPATAGPIGPGGQFGSAPILIEDDVIRGMVEGRLRYFVWGRCEYEDIFPNSPRHWLTFCVEGIITTDIFRQPYDVAKQIIAQNRGRLPSFLAFPAYGRGNDSDD
jgi:hypothetical protein